jgi:hypothetical protein
VLAEIEKGVRVELVHELLRRMKPPLSQAMWAASAKKTRRRSYTPTQRSSLLRRYRGTAK